MSIFPPGAPRKQLDRASGYLFEIGMDDLTLVPSTDQVVTFTRAGGRTVFDSDGRVATLAKDQPPWGAVYNSEAGIWEPTLDMQSARTNLVLQTEDFGVTWAAIGTPTRTAAAKLCGDLILDLIGDDNASGLEGYSQVVTFTTDAVKGVGIFLAAGTSTSTVIRLRDTTASANRLLARVTWSGGVPTVAMTTGSSVGTIACFGGVYWFLFQTTSVTVANANQLEVYPATDAALATSGTGTVYAGGVSAENETFTRSYTRNTSASVATAVDNCSVSVDIPIDAAGFTIFGRIARPTWHGSVAGASAVIIGQEYTAANGCFQVYTGGASHRIYTQISQGASAEVVFQATPGTSAIEFCVQYADLTTAPRSRVDVGGGFGSWTATVPAISTWVSSTIHLGGLTSRRIDAGFRRLVIAAGQRTLAELRGPQP